MYSTRYSCQISMKLEFSQQIFEKYSNILFHNNNNNNNNDNNICHGGGPLVDPFRSHVSRSLFEGLPWFLPSVGSRVSLPWVIYFEAFYLHVVSSFSCIPVISLKLMLFLTSLQFVHLFHEIPCSCSMHTDWQTDTTKLIVALLNFANRPKNRTLNRQKGWKW